MAMAKEVPCTIELPRRRLPQQTMRRCVSKRYLIVLMLTCCCVFSRHQRHHTFVGAFTPPSSSLCARRTTRQPIATTWVTNDATKATRSSSAGLEASPSGIDEWPQISQAAVFFGTYAALFLTTYPATKVVESFSTSVIGLERWRINVIDSTLPILMGVVYLAAGVGHFTSSQAFQDIYPPIGTWGIWYLPGSAAFHVAWTGVVEVLGGFGLLFSGVRDVFGSEEEEVEEGNTTLLISFGFIKPISASVLFLLTVLVTPANIYMFTHGAVMGDSMPPLDTAFHLIRFGVQVVFLTLLLTLARDSFFYAWGDELD